MGDKTHGFHDEIFGRKEKVMRAALMDDVKGMAGFLLAKEHRGPGDTIEAASYRVQTKYGVPASFLMRLRHREVKDIMMSNFIALATAYQAALNKVDRAYEHEKALADSKKILRLARALAGEEGEG